MLRGGTRSNIFLSISLPLKLLIFWLFHQILLSLGFLSFGEYILLLPPTKSMSEREHDSNKDFYLISGFRRQFGILNLDVKKMQLEEFLVGLRESGQSTRYFSFWFSDNVCMCFIWYTVHMMAPAFSMFSPFPVASAQSVLGICLLNEWIWCHNPRTAGLAGPGIFQYSLLLNRLASLKQKQWG